MKTFTLFCILLFAAHAHGITENWTRESDQATIIAELIEYDTGTGKVRLKLENGNEVAIDHSVLIAAHKERLDKHAKELADRKKAAEQPRLESFTPENGGEHKVHVYKPAGYLDGHPSSQSRPAAFLYSAGGNSMQLVNRLKPAADELGWVLIGVDAYRNTSSLEEKYDERMEHTKAAFEWAVENVDFSKEKIVFGGMSGGAWWSYQSAAELTRDAAGILAFGGWMGNMYDQRYSRDMAVAMINGDQDKNAISYEEKDGEFLKKKASATIEVIHFPGGHVIAPPEVALKAARWIHQTKSF